MRKLKRLVIGDIHGHWDSLKAAYDKEQPNSVIIIGDYFDNFHGTDQSIIDCFENIVALKHEHESKNNGSFTLLIGNHDYHYMCNFERYSGYRNSYATYASLKLSELRDAGELTWAYVDKANRIIYSHAGVSKSWFDDNVFEGADPDTINDVNDIAFRFTYRGGGDAYGNTKYASPIWIRPESLKNDMYVDKDGNTWSQTVGHTHSDFVKEYDFGNGIFLSIIDCMPEAYVVETLDFETEKLLGRTVVKLR